MRLVRTVVVLLLAACASPAPSPPSSATPAGPGRIVFGRELATSGLVIASPVATFEARPGVYVAWRAELSEPAQSTSVELIVARQEGTGERLLRSEVVKLTTPDTTVVAGELHIDQMAEGLTGTFVLRYVREGRILAEGEFTVVE